MAVHCLVCYLHSESGRFASFGFVLCVAACLAALFESS